MRIETIRAVLLAVTATFICAIANATPSETTVVGTNAHPNDVQAVQQALDNFDVVTLSGTFDFGEGEFPATPAGTVFVTRPNSVLQGPATIVGGGSPSYPWDIWPVIDVSAPGVTVRDLTLVDSADTGIYVHGSVGPSTTPAGVMINDNTISAEWAGILVYGYRMDSDEPIKIAGNSITSSWIGVYLTTTGGFPMEVRGNNIRSDSIGIFSNWTGHYFDWVTWDVHKATKSLDIIDNEVVIGGSDRWYWLPDAILIVGWRVDPANIPPNLPPGTNPAEWGDNGPVTISGNLITCIPVSTDQFLSAINLGRSASGLNNSLVSNNTLRGECDLGITKWPYGSDNAIIENDHAGLTTQFEQIGVRARNTVVTNNILGVAIEPPALFVWSLNAHPYPDPLNTPMPLPVENCVIMDNDYTLTGLPGWSEGGGAIMVASDADLGWAWGVGTEVRNNYIFEAGSFPEGSGSAKKHVYEMIVEPDPLVHDNRIVGLPANHSSDPGIGQMIKGVRSGATLQGAMDQGVEK